MDKSKIFKNFSLNKLTFIILVGFILRIILLFISNSHPDVGNHLDWGIRFWQYGPKTFYDQSVWSVSWPNQPFGTIYLFALLSQLKDIIYNVFLYLNSTIPLFPSKIIWILETNLHTWLVKFPFIICDLLIAILIKKIVDNFNPKYSLLAAAIYIFNPIVIYNSTIWGQTDSIINFLTILGIYKTYRKKYFVGIFSFLSAFIFKMSLIIYIPIFIIILFKNIKDLNKIIISTIVSLAIIILLALPFWYGNNPIEWFYRLYTYYVYGHQGNMLNGNAFNIWFIAYGADLTRQDSLVIYNNLSAKTISYVFTFIILFFVWIKLLLKKKFNLNSILYSCFVTSLISFSFLTNMHERYLYPIFPIVPILIFEKSSRISIFSYIVFSLIHLLNLYNLWFYPDIYLLKNILITNDFIFGKILSLFIIILSFKYLIDYFKSD